MLARLEVAGLRRPAVEIRSEEITSKNGPEALAALMMVISGDAIPPSTVTTSRTEKKTLNRCKSFVYDS